MTAFTDFITRRRNDKDKTIQHSLAHADEIRKRHESEERDLRKLVDFFSEHDIEMSHENGTEGGPSCRSYRVHGKWNMR